KEEAGSVWGVGSGLRIVDSKIHVKRGYVLSAAPNRNILLGAFCARHTICTILSRFYCSFSSFCYCFSYF
ncbi:MAG: hypothetical protein RI601_12890, partial [Desulfurivibrionaceae bacterium]|nr:hypothetical protein [Desulfurivibrionaceae bacterium]